MKARGTILMPVYHPADVNCTELLHYISEISVELEGKKWECNYQTPVNVFKDLKGESKKSYTTWLESYLKRSIANVMINDGVNFSYA